MHRTAGLIANSLPAAIQGICLHNSTPTAAIRVIIHLALLAGSILSYLMRPNLKNTSLLRSSQNTVRKHIN
jgi:hypothetical protein